MNPASSAPTTSEIPLMKTRSANAPAEMERQTACDIPGETPAERYERGCNECFVCPKCKFQELFPFASMTVADMRRLYPDFGARRSGYGDAA